MSLIGYRRSGQHAVYTVPFSKEKVNEIIESSTGNAVNDIQFVVKDVNYRYGPYTYSQFCNYSFEECLDAGRCEYGPSEFERQKVKAEKKAQELLKNSKQYS